MELFRKYRNPSSSSPGDSRDRAGSRVSVVPYKDSLELQTLNPELKRPPQSFCYVQSELDLPMKG